MLRRLLACLALLTGLTAAGTPAHAQVMAELSAQVEASPSRATVRSNAPLVVRHDFSAGVSPILDRVVSALVQANARLAPPVRIGVDRARE